MDGGAAWRFSGSGGGGGKGGGGGHTPSEDPNTLRSTSVASIVDMVSAGPIGGLVNGAHSIFLNDTPLQNADGSYNFAPNGNHRVTWVQRTGELDQDYIPGFEDADATLVVNVEVTWATPIVRTYISPVDAARITVSVPALTYQDKDDGDLHGSEVELFVSVRPSGTSAWGAERLIKIEGKTVSSYQRAVRVELGGAGNWDIRLRRGTLDSSEANLQNKTWWATTSLITDGKFQYPGCALLALSADAQYFGTSIPARGYDLSGRLVQVPANYDSGSRTYAGIWDGTFQTAWTDNPAWVAYDLLTDPLIGLGRLLGVSEVDKYALYDIARYCDQMVPNGRGGYEPRFSFNYQIMQADNAYSVLQAVASCFRGMSYFGSGRVTFAADMPSDPVKLIASSNVIDGLFTYEGTAYSAQHSVCRVTWFDPDDLCRQAIELVEDPELIARFGWRPLDIVAYACTSQGQARRMGLWALDTEKYAQDTINFEMALDGIDLVPGDIIEVYDPDYSGIRLAGRMASSTDTSITVDAPIAIESGKNYTLKITMPDGSLAARPLTNTSGTATVLTFSDPLPDTPVDAAAWGVTVNDLAPRQYRILSITETARGRYAISALFHDPTKYDRVEQNVRVEPPVYTRYRAISPNAPVDFTIKEYVKRVGGILAAAMTISWTPPNDTGGVATYEVRRRRANGNWSSMGTTPGTSMDMDAEAGSWSFEIRAIGFSGLSSDWLSRDVELFGMAAAPADVTGLSLNVLGDMATLAWRPVSDLDLSHYRVKFSPMTSGATWAAATDLLPIISVTSAQVPTMTGTYLVKAVDLSGSESVNAAAVVTTAATLSNYNAVALIDDSPGWSGAHDGTYSISGELRLLSVNTWDTIGAWSTLGSFASLASGIVPSGVYTFADVFDLGDIYTSRLTAAITARGANVANTWKSMGKWKTAGSWNGTDAEQWGVRLQVRTTNDDPSGSPVWGEWRDLVVGDYTARAFLCRLILSSGDTNVTPVIDAATISIDMPDRVASTRSVSVPSGGLAVTFSPAFRATPAIGITGQDMQPGDRFQFDTAPSATGFAIRFFNGSGTAVARTMDWIAHGYGRASS